MASDVVEIPEDPDFIEVLGSAPEPSEYDPDVWRVEAPVGDAGDLVALSFDIGARSVRLTRESMGECDIEIYREQGGSNSPILARGGVRDHCGSGRS